MNKINLTLLLENMRVVKYWKGEKSQGNKLFVISTSIPKSSES